MTDIENAINRIFAAQTADEIQAILTEEPELFTPEADQMLAARQKEAQDQGNQAMVDALMQLRDVLRSVSVTPDFELPNLPGAMVAADLIHALIAAAPDVPVPPAALCDVFFVVLDALRDHVRKNELESMLENLSHLDERIAEAQQAAANAPRPAPDDEPLLITLQEWVDSPTWLLSHEFLLAHPQLTSKDTIVLLTLLGEGAVKRGTLADAEVLDQHRQILVSIKTGRLEDTYLALIQDEQKERDGE